MVLSYLAANSTDLIKYFVIQCLLKSEEMQPFQKVRSILWKIPHKLKKTMDHSRLYRFTFHRPEFTQDAHIIEIQIQSESLLDNS